MGGPELREFAHDFVTVDCAVSKSEGTNYVIAYIPRGNQGLNADGAEERLLCCDREKCKDLRGLLHGDTLGVGQCRGRKLFRLAQDGTDLPPSLPTWRDAQLAIFESVLGWSRYPGTTSTVGIPLWATPAPVKSNGAPHPLPSRPNEPLHRNGPAHPCCPAHAAMESIVAIRYVGGPYLAIGGS